jgi:hypothetical protein
MVALVMVPLVARAGGTAAKPVAREVREANDAVLAIRGVLSHVTQREDDARAARVERIVMCLDDRRARLTELVRSVADEAEGVRISVTSEAPVTVVHDELQRIARLRAEAEHIQAAADNCGVIPRTAAKPDHISPDPDDMWDPLAPLVRTPPQTFLNVGPVVVRR